MTTNSLRKVLVFGLTLAAVLSFSTTQVHANVFASNVKINGSLDSATTGQGQSVNISYILNEPASAGVTIQILSGPTVVHTIAIAAGAPGTTRGLNTVAWDGKDSGGANVPIGSYSVSIAAASEGYDAWTTTTSDLNDGNYVWEGRGIAVNQNSKSPYYGRIFVGNSRANTGTKLGDQVGIQKLNADGSYADEGGFSTGGHTWAGDFFSPWHIQVSDDDYVYINDWTGQGEIYRWDQTLAPETMLHVLRSDNWAGSCNLGGPFIFGAGANTEIYMADIAYPASQGVVKYTVTQDGTVAIGDIGTPVVPIGYPLSLYPYDVALDKKTNYYLVQYRSNTTDASPRVMCYDMYGSPVWDTATLYGAAQQDNTWAYANSVAADPTGTYLAVAFRGNGGTSGNTKIFEAATGVIVTNLDFQINVNGTGTSHQDRGCCWDAVGNVYYIDNWYGIWRAVSPPGSNSSKTEPPVLLAITAAAAPIEITTFGLNAGVFSLSFTAGSTDQASAFEVLSALSAEDLFTPAAGQNITGSAGNFQATVSAVANAQFYKIHRK